MDKVLERLYIGNQSDGMNPQPLRDVGVTAVMNATHATDSLDKQEFSYLRLNQYDGDSIEEKVLREFLSWMMGVMYDGKNKVLIHCGAGVSRASTFTIAWLMNSGFGWDEAEALVRSKRPIVRPHEKLKQSVLDFFKVKQ